MTCPDCEALRARLKERTYTLAEIEAAFVNGGDRSVADFARPGPSWRAEVFRYLKEGGGK